MGFFQGANLYRSILIIFLVIIFDGCSLRKFAIREVISLIQESREVFEKEEDLEIAEASLSSNLKLLEALWIHDKENPELNLFLAEGYSLYALAFVETKKEEAYFQENEEEENYQKNRAILFYKRAKNYAYLVLQEKVGNIEDLPIKEFQKRISSLSKEDIPSLFWYAFSWGSSLNLQRESTEALREIPKIEIMMQKVKEEDPTFYFGGAYLFEGIYYGSRAPLLGGDPEKSLLAFKKAEEITKRKLLLVPFYRAITYCITYQKKSCFKKDIPYVLQTSLSIFPEQKLANQVAKKRASLYWKNRDRFFLPEEIR